jgi:hypothetical protein
MERTVQGVRVREILDNVTILCCLSEPLPVKGEPVGDRMVQVLVKEIIRRQPVNQFGNQFLLLRHADWLAIATTIEPRPEGLCQFRHGEDPQAEPTLGDVWQSRQNPPLLCHPRLTPHSGGSRIQPPGLLEDAVAFGNFVINLHHHGAAGNLLTCERQVSVPLPSRPKQLGLSSRLCPSSSGRIELSELGADHQDMLNEHFLRSSDPSAHHLPTGVKLEKSPLLLRFMSQGSLFPEISSLPWDGSHGAALPIRSTSHPTASSTREKRSCAREG